MEYIAYIIFALLLLFSLLQLWIFWSTKRQQGKPLPELHGLVDDELLARSKLLFYFYSEHCGPCRALTPQIERLQAEHDHVIKVDIRQQMDLARRLSVMGTPTLLAVENGVVSRIHVGSISPDKLEQMV